MYIHSLKEFDSKVLRNTAIKRGQVYHIEPILELATAWGEKEDPPK
jgi:hypothetical protein